MFLRNNVQGLNVPYVSQLTLIPPSMVIYMAHSSKIMKTSESFRKKNCKEVLSSFVCGLILFNTNLLNAILFISILMLELQILKSVIHMFPRWGRSSLAYLRDKWDYSPTVSHSPSLDCNKSRVCLHRNCEDHTWYNWYEDTTNY
jgi:hypothetical protein